MSYGHINVGNIALLARTRNLFLFVLPLLVFDIVLARLGTPYLTEKISFFSRESTKKRFERLFFSKEQHFWSKRFRRVRDLE